MRRLLETNMEQTPGYGDDPYCESARSKIREAVGDPDADVFFLVGGTQTNSTVIASMLGEGDGVVSARSGHIGVHESGAVEYTGHKVLTLPSHDGRILASELSDFLEAFHSDPACGHMVWPGMVYISFPTEYGTVYGRKELEDIHEVCRRRDIPLYIDGARLAYGLAAPGGDVSLEDLPHLCEVFYIGGTKVGALFGEAVVFPRHGAPRRFFSTVKMHGALLAKGRLLGIQFDTLFTDGLYLEMGRNAVDMAMKVKELFVSRGYRMFRDSPTNQQFVILTDALVKEISKGVRVEYWEPYNKESSVVRIATSWASTDADIEELSKHVPVLQTHSLSM